MAWGFRRQPFYLWGTGNFLQYSHNSRAAKVLYIMWQLWP